MSTAEASRLIMRHSSLPQRVAAIVSLPLLLVLAGCDKGDYPEMAKVTGTVTYKGKPVPNMMVNFMPTEGRPSWGKTDANGRFEMIYDSDYKGVKMGHHKVYFTPPANTTIDGGQSKASKKALAEAAGLTPEEMSEFSKKYGAEMTTQLEVDVKKDPEDLKLDLQ
jgi:hypothetical protein